jgi:GxxExxY protein
MARKRLIEKELTHAVVAAFYEVYNTLGFGLFEHVYRLAMERELAWRGHHVAREVSVCIRYKGEELTRQRLDLLVDNRLVVETKSTHILHPTAQRQVYNYLRATHLEVGLLLHFGPEPKFYRVVCENSFKRKPTG